MVEYNPRQKVKVESIGIVNMNHTIHKGRAEKLHYFQYRDQHMKMLKEKEKKKDDKTFVKDEMRLLTKIGFVKDKTSEIPNSTLYRLNTSQGSLLWKAAEKEKEVKIKFEKDNLKRDEDYVKTLNNWERKTLTTLPKIK
jgi:hypothetical protein